MRVLAIESSCDETAAAVVAGGRSVLSSVVSSQVRLHARYGGVVPEVASREHAATIGPVIRAAVEEAGCGLEGIEAVAATRGPGLAGSLLVGYNAAKALAFGRGLPFLGVDHLEGHVYANWLVEGPEPRFPCLCLIVSGGHTELVLMHAHGRFERVGGTRDDAAGEAFDKVGRLLEMPFPGGPQVARAADEHGPSGFELPRAWMHGTHDFSFSGLKTAVLHEVRGGRRGTGAIASAFQEAVVDVLAAKTSRAARETGVQEVLVAGGVGANRRLREELQRRCPVTVRIPPPALCTDNAAMIGAVAGFRLAAGQRSPLNEDIYTSSIWKRPGARGGGVSPPAAAIG